jgi:hypothetical protein
LSCRTPSGHFLDDDLGLAIGGGSAAQRLDAALDRLQERLRALDRAHAGVLGDAGQRRAQVPGVAVELLDDRLAAARRVRQVGQDLLHRRVLDTEREVVASGLGRLPALAPHRVGLLRGGRGGRGQVAPRSVTAEVVGIVRVVIHAPVVRAKFVEFAARGVLSRRGQAGQLGQSIRVVGAAVVVGLALQLLVACRARGRHRLSATLAALELAELLGGVVPVVFDVAEVLGDPARVAVVTGDLLQLVGIAVGLANLVARPIDR